MVRGGYYADRAQNAVRSAAPRGSGPSLASQGVLGVLDRMCAVMPPRIKLEIAERVRHWADEKRRDAMQQLGIDEQPAPAEDDGPETFTTQGTPQW